MPPLRLRARGKPVPAQVRRGSAAAVAVVAVDDDLAGGIQLALPVLQVADRDEQVVVQAHEGVLERLAHVEQERPVAPVQPGLQLLDGDDGIERRRERPAAFASASLRRPTPQNAS